MDHISRVGIFLEVVKHQSFTKAAKKLGMTGPALSKQVKSLEEYLGVRLLNRTTRQITLTEEGALYNERARKALEDLDEAEQQIQELKSCPTGVLRVNAPMSFGKRYLTSPIASFAKKYPNVKMEVDFDDRQVDIIGEGYDVVIRIGALKDSSFVSRKLAACPLVLCSTPKLFEKYGVPQKADDITNFPAIIYSKNGIENIWQYCDEKGKVSFVNLKQKFLGNNGDIILEACLQSVGIALLPIFIVSKYLQSGQLVEILPQYKTHPQRAIYVIFPQNRHLSTKVRLFVDCLTDCSKDFPW